MGGGTSLTTIAGSSVVAPSGQTAQEIYDAAVEGYDNIRDPILRVACAFLRLDLAMAGTIQTRADAVQAIARKMADAHDVMAALNASMQALATAHPGADDSQRWRIFGDADEIKAAEFYEGLLDSGVLPQGFSDTANGPPPHVSTEPDKYWEVVMTKGQITAAVQAIQGRVDNLSSQSQQEQLDLQTLMNRFNSLVEAITAAIKKYEGEAVSADNGIKGP